MKQTIRTKSHSATNTLGRRISAATTKVRIYVPYDHALDYEDNHAAACQELCARLGWTGPRVGGQFGFGVHYWVAA